MSQCRGVKTITSRIAPLAAIFLVAFAATSQAAATLLPLDPYPYYRPLGQAPGQTYGIAALYRIDPSQSPNPFPGATLISGNPNVGNAFPGGIGVYSPDTGHFGIGLYDNGNAIQSTGLQIKFDVLQSSDGLNLSLGNFGIDSLITGFDAGRVAPMISIYGVGSTVLGTFNAADIITNNAMTLLTSGNPLDPSYSSVFTVDTWKLDISALIGPTAQVRALVIGADIQNGQGSAIGASSSPYYLISANGCAPVPEPGSAFLILTSALGLIIIRRRRMQF